jgi:hypothetical protein
MAACLKSSQRGQPDCESGVKANDLGLDVMFQHSKDFPQKKRFFNVKFGGLR